MTVYIVGTLVGTIFMGVMAASWLPPEFCTRIRWPWPAAWEAEV